jgi:hypothetical protein
MGISAWLWIGVTALAQSGGSITGTVSGPSGTAISGAPLQLKNEESGTIYRASSSDAGNYTLASLPTGSYEMYVAIPGLKVFQQKSVVIQAT